MSAMSSIVLFIGQLAVLLVATVALVYYFFLLPPKYPVGIPVIPFWVALLPLFKDVDQKETFQKYIEGPLRTHGAVKIFFASQWNVLVHRPSYIADIFKREDQYQKSGNQKKIPGSVLASFLGDNIISSHGDDWKLYQGVIKPGLQKRFEEQTLFANAHRLRDLLLQAQESAAKSGVAVQELFQRYTIANIAQLVLGTDFGTLKSGDAYLNKLQSSIKRQIFSPIFMSFPFLDSLGLPGREATRRQASHFTDTLVAGVSRAAASIEKTLASPSDVGPRLVSAWKSGELTEKQFRDNVTISFVAGQENPQLGLISIMYLLAKHPDVQESLYEEMASVGDEGADQDTLNEMARLSAVIYESLRLLPPIGQLINRRASEPILLDSGIFIPEGTYLGYNCYSTNRDPAAWGSDADDFRPDRWGQTSHEVQKEFRRRRARAEFISFHGGRRACLGERFALLELKATLFVLVKGLRWRLDPDWSDRMTPAGPLCPRALRLVIEAR